MMRGLRRGAGSRRGTGRAAAASLALCAVAGLLAVGCAGSGSSGVATTLKSMSYNLYTHCGVDEALIDGRYYEAVRPLSDGNGNPPPGWGNPYQHGTMTIVSATEAVFTDKAGHRVVFKVRPGAKGFKHICS